MKSLFTLLACAVIVMFVIKTKTVPNPVSEETKAIREQSIFNLSAQRWLRLTFADPMVSLMNAGEKFLVHDQFYRPVTLRGRDAKGGFVSKNYVLLLGSDGVVLKGYEGTRPPEDAVRPPQESELVFDTRFLDWLRAEKRDVHIDLIKIGPKFHVNNIAYRQGLLRAPGQDTAVLDKKFLFEVGTDESIVRAYPENAIPFELREKVALVDPKKWAWEK